MGVKRLPAVRLTRGRYATENFQLRLAEQRAVAALGVAPRQGGQTMGIRLTRLRKANLAGCSHSLTGLIPPSGEVERFFDVVEAGQARHPWPMRFPDIGNQG
jgi:hypothetical protein